MQDPFPPTAGNFILLAKPAGQNRQAQNGVGKADWHRANQSCLDVERLDPPGQLTAMKRYYFTIELVSTK